MSIGVPRVLHANCFVPDGLEGDLLLTDEPTVAEAAGARGLPVVVPEQSVSSDLAHSASVELWRLAFSWFRHSGGDDTVVEGVSVGDLAGLEAAQLVLAPAMRGALSMAAALSQQPDLTELLLLHPQGTPGGERYDRVERLASATALRTARALGGEGIRAEQLPSADPRNVTLRDKYARTRDVEPLGVVDATRHARQMLLSLVNCPAMLRRRGSGALLVVDYNPTLAFSRRYASTPGRRRLVRWLNDRREILPSVRAGDVVMLPTMPVPRRGEEFTSAWRSLRSEEGAHPRVEVAGVDLWPVVASELLDLLEHYAGFAAAGAPRLRRQLRRWRVEAVLVPYDNPPSARLLVRVAQSLGIPTFVLNDGYKADDIQTEGMSTDVALAWSEAIRENYFVRHPGKVFVTGNPRSEFQQAHWRGLPQTPPRLLVGTFTFSPSDLNCRRFDAERFLEEVLAGIVAALPHVSNEVVIKLHPADEPAHYRDLLARRTELRVRLETTGDVVDLFGECDVYLTSYSTSLLEAVSRLPAVYYRVNEQRIGPPFSGDEFLSRRTASTPSELADLLCDRETLAAPPPEEWIERYIGPPGATARIAAAIESQLSGEGVAREWSAAQADAPPP